MAGESSPVSVRMNARTTEDGPGATGAVSTAGTSSVIVAPDVRIEGTLLGRA
jgi:hypothetical protein